jgi:hypothetical protein
VKRGPAPVISSPKPAPTKVFETISQAGALLRTRARYDSSADDTETTRASKHQRVKEMRFIPKCGCDNLAKVIVKRLPTDKKHMGDEAGTKILKWVYNMEAGFTQLCHSHLRHLAVATMGLKNSYSGASTESLRRRILYCLRNRNHLKDVRRKHYDWFLEELQENIVRRELGGMKYAHVAATPVAVDPERIWRWYGDASVWDTFQADGTANIKGVFSWMLEDIELAPLIDKEFRLYSHHSHQPGNPGKRLGWLRNMWYSLVQQVVRQDPAYYALMVAARPDLNHWLISYPYYTKLTETCESTGFHHLDMNIKSFVEKNKGGNIVQGGVTLDDETPRNCTVLVPGFHKDVHRWYNDLKKRGQGNVKGHTTDLKHLYTPADRAKYGDWVAVPCKRGDVRITLPQIIHGATSKADGERRVIFPWFTGIQHHDHDTLDNEESESWTELAACHRDMVPCTKSPSGRGVASYQRGAPFRAPVTLPSTSRIGDALVGRAKWTSPQVHREVKILFGVDKDQSYALVGSTREHLKEAYLKGFEELQEVEKEVYGPNSFFYLEERGLAAPVPDGVEDMDFSDGSVISNFSDITLTTSGDEIESE